MSDGLEFEEEYDETVPVHQAITPSAQEQTIVNERNEEKEQDSAENPKESVIVEKSPEKEVPQQSKKKEQEDLEFEDETFEIEEETTPKKKDDTKTSSLPPVETVKKDIVVEDLIKDENVEDPNEDLEKILDEDMNDMPQHATELVLQTKGDKFSKISPLFSPTLDKQNVTYDEFLNLIVSDQKILSILYSMKVFKLTDIDEISLHLTNCAISLDAICFLFEGLLSLEFDSSASSKAKAILRSNTIATKALDHFIKITAQSFVKDILGQILEDFLKCGYEIEIDDGKITTPEILEIAKNETLDPDTKKTQIDAIKQEIVSKNIKILEENTLNIFNAITNPRTIDMLPREIRWICAIIRDLATAYDWSIYPLVGSFVFLRIFNPAIVFCDKKQIVKADLLDKDGNVSNAQRRNLILVTKVLQNISNGLQFGAKEKYMLPLNSITSTCIKKSEEFIRNCCLSPKEMSQARSEMQASKEIKVSNQIITKACLPNAQFLHQLFATKLDTIEDFISQSFVRDQEAAYEEFKQFLGKLPELPEDMKPKPKILSKTEEEASNKTESSKKEKTPEKEKKEPKYEALLKKALETDTSDLEYMNILTVRGPDSEGRPVIVFTEASITQKKDLDRVLLFVIKKLDPIVNNEYSVVYCVNNSAGGIKPGFSWMWNAYLALSRKYKKNLKGLIILHPKGMLKLLIGLFGPFISEKFWRKFKMAASIADVYSTSANNLIQKIEPEKVPLPPSVFSYEFSRKQPAAQKIPLFGSKLDDVMQRSEQVNKKVPAIVEKCINEIKARGLDKEGIFRLSGRQSEITKLKYLLDLGANLDMAHVEMNDISGILKLFFRELTDRLLPVELTDTLDANATPAPVVQDDEEEEVKNTMFPSIVKEKEQRNEVLPKLKDMMTKKMGKVHFETARMLFGLLQEIVAHESESKMTAENMAIVFAPTLFGNDMGGDPLQALKNTKKRMEIIKHIVVNYDYFFDA